MAWSTRRACRSSQLASCWLVSCRPWAANQPAMMSSPRGPRPLTLSKRACPRACTSSGVKSGRSKSLLKALRCLVGRQAARFSCGPPPAARSTSTAIAVTANTQEPAPVPSTASTTGGRSSRARFWPSRRSGGFSARTLTVAGAYLRNSTPELPSVAGTGLAASKAESTVAIWQVMDNGSGSCRDARSVRQATVQINDGIRIWIYAGPDHATLSRPARGACGHLQKHLRQRRYAYRK